MSGQSRSDGEHGFPSAHRHTTGSQIFFGFFEKNQIALTVLVILEDRLALIAPTHDVIERTGKMYPRLSSHNGRPQFENHKLGRVEDWRGVS